MSRSVAQEPCTDAPVIALSTSPPCVDMMKIDTMIKAYAEELTVVNVTTLCNELRICRQTGGSIISKLIHVLKQGLIYFQQQLDNCACQFWKLLHNFDPDRIDSPRILRDTAVYRCLSYI